MFCMWVSDVAVPRCSDLCPRCETPAFSLVDCRKILCKRRPTPEMKRCACELALEAPQSPPWGHRCRSWLSFVTKSDERCSDLASSISPISCQRKNRADHRLPQPVFHNCRSNYSRAKSVLIFIVVQATLPLFTGCVVVIEKIYGIFPPRSPVTSFK